MQNIDQELLDLVRSKLPEKEVGAIKEIVERNQELVEKCNSLKNSLDGANKIIEDLKKTNEALNNKELSVERRELEVGAREKEASDKIEAAEKKEFKVDLDKALAEKNVYKETIGMLLRNTEIRKTYQKQIPTESFDYNSGRQTGTYVNQYQESEHIVEE